MALSIDEAARRHAAYYLKVLRSANDQLERGDDEAGLRLFDRDRDQIMHGFSWAADNASRIEDAARLCSAYPYDGELIVYLRLPAQTRIGWSSQAAEAAALIDDDGARAAHLHKLAMALLDVGELQPARDNVQKAIAINRAIDRPEYLASNFGGLGLIHAAAGEHHAAVSAYEDALDLYGRVDAPWGEGIYRSNLGASLTALGRPSESISMLESALDLNRSVGDTRSEGYTLGYLARAHSTLGHEGLALELIEKQLRIALSFDDPQMKAYAKLERARALAALTRCEEARTEGRAALSLLDELKDPRLNECRDVVRMIESSFQAPAEAPEDD